MLNIITLHEKFNIQGLYNILTHPEKYEAILNKETNSTKYNGESYITVLKKIFNTYDVSKGHMTTLYSQKSKNIITNELFGRFFANGSKSLQNISRAVRHTLSGNLYTHISFLSWYCHNHNIECCIIDDYIENRDEYFIELKKYYNVEKDVVKEMFLKLINNGGIYKDADKPIHPFLQKFKKECVDISERIRVLEPEFYKTAVENSKQKEWKNTLGSCVNYLLCNIENQVLTVMKESCEALGLVVGVLCFDGLMVEGKSVINSHLIKIEKDVKSKLGITITLVIKEPDEKFKILDDIKVPENFKFDLIDKILLNKYLKNEEIKEDVKGDFITVNTKQLESYEKYLKEYNTIFICSNMGSGKSYWLRNIIKDKKLKVLIITYRCSLSEEFTEKLNIPSYADITTTHIDAKRLVCQIDSLWRIDGEFASDDGFLEGFDIVVLDECSYMLTHMINFVKEKKLVNDNLERILKTAKKVIVLDANLRQRHINIINQMREKKSFLTIKNEGKTYGGYKCNYIKGGVMELINSVVEAINLKKKVVVPSNSQTAIKKLRDQLLVMYPKLKICYMDADTGVISTQFWGKYDVLIYSPSIEAGLSFDEEWYDELICYFTTKTTSPSSATQMMFRVRKFVDKKITIIGQLDVVRCLSTTEDGIERNIRNSIIPFKDMGFDVRDMSVKCKKSDYFKRYVSITLGNNIERMLYKQVLKGILENHGIVWNEKGDVVEEIVSKKEVQENHSIGLYKEAREIINSYSLTEDEFKALKGKVLTTDEKLSVKKYIFEDVFGSENITEEMYVELEPYINVYRTQKILKSSGLKYFMEKIGDGAKLIRKSPTTDTTLDKYLDSSKDSNHSFKVVYLVNLLDELGYDLFKEEFIKFDYSRAWAYILEKKSVWCKVFGRCRMKWDMEITSGDGQKSIMKYIEPKLKSVLGMKFENKSKKVSDNKQLCSVIKPLVVKYNIRDEYNLHLKSLLRPM